jgi:hypothetical protein
MNFAFSLIESVARLSSWGLSLEHEIISDENE